MSKQAYREQPFDDSTPTGAEVRIKGLHHSHDDVFFMEGLTVKPLMQEQIAEMERTLGRTLHPGLIDDIASVLRKWDLIDVLAERITL